MYCKFQRQASGQTYVGASNALQAVSMYKPNASSWMMDVINVSTGTYRVYALTNNFPISYRVRYYSGGETYDAETTGTINFASNQDSMGAYSEFTVSAATTYVSILFYQATGETSPIITQSVATYFVSYIKVLYGTPTSWQDYGKVVAPLTIGETITNNYSKAYKVELYFKGATEMATAPLKPSDIVRIVFGDSSKTYYYVIIDGGKVLPTGDVDYCKHVYTIQEALAYAREIYVQTSFFTYGKYTLATFLQRLIALSKSDKTLSFSTSYSYQTMLDNWLSSDYQVASNSLLDNLAKIGAMLGVRLKAQINSSGYFEIYAVDLKGTSTIDIDGNINGENEQYLGANYASKTIANIENMGTDQTYWWPSAEPAFGAQPVPSSENDSTITVDTMVVRTDKPIISATQVRVQGFGKVITDSVTAYTAGNYKFFDTDGNEIVADAGKYTVFRINAEDIYRAPSGAVIYQITEYKNWLLLPATGAYSKATALYYKTGENKIYNTKICTGAATAANSTGLIYVFKTYDAGWNLLTTTNYYQSQTSFANRYSVKANFYLDGIMTQSNKSIYSRTAFYNQEDNVVSGKALMQNMKGYIDSMTNTDVSISCVFNSGNDIPNVGEIYDGKVISDINLTIDNSVIQASLTLSDEIVPKSEYLSADGGLTLPTIPIDKAYNRFKSYNTNIWICKTSTEADLIVATYPASSYLNIAQYAEELLNGMMNSRTLPQQLPTEVLMRTGDGAGTYVYTALQCVTNAVGNSIILSFQTIDNVTVGFLADRTAGLLITNMVFYPVSFINSTGVSVNLSFKVSINSERLGEANYPAIAAATYTGLSNPFMTVEDTIYYHDVSEIPHINCQIVFKEWLSSTKIHQSLIEESTIFKDCFFTGDDYDRYVEFGSGGYDDEYINNVTVTTSSDRALVKVFITGTDINLANYIIKIYRTDDGGVTKDYMLEMVAALSTDGGNKCFSFYAVFTN